jgi:hypothetical protein
MPKDLLKQLDDYCSQFPGLPRSTILKAMVVVGLDHKAKVRDAVGRY